MDRTDGIERIPKGLRCKGEWQWGYAVLGLRHFNKINDI